MKENDVIDSPRVTAYRQAGHAVACDVIGRAPPELGIFCDNRFCGPDGEYWRATGERPANGSYVPARLRLEVEDTAAAYAAGAVAGLRLLEDEPKCHCEPDGALFPEWAAVEALVARVVPSGHPGEAFHTRLSIYRRMSRVLATAENWAAVEALADALLTRRVLPTSRALEVIAAARRRTTPVPTSAAPKNRRRTSPTPPCPHSGPSVSGRNVVALCANERQEYD